ncbi:hypothetical protein ACMATS_20875 [Streptoverticillium reticulum]|uniref:hypothetical protein n=1 Tax=Streptoverticillium reticulum TaxID=1433415 RepID=UPI0039BFB5CB
MPKYEPPAGFPVRLLASAEMIEACRDHDFSAIFQLAKRAGMYPALIGRRIGVTPSAATEILKGRRTVREFQLVQRIADGLRIPGHMLGLSRRDWEPDTGEDAGQAACPVPSPVWAPDDAAAEGLSPTWPEAEPDDPEFAAELIECQLPQHYKDANYFGSRHAIPAVTQYAQTVTRLLETASGTPRQALLRTGGKVAEFIGWLHQDRGDFKSAAYWSDRAMEWAQEAAAEHMQAYILFRKSNQATARASGDRAIGLAKAAQRLPGLTPRLSALAAQQEAQGYALMRNSKAALSRFDEAYALASQATAAEQPTTVDASYCTPTYIEIQRATCWIDLGQPQRAVQLFQDQLAALDPVYRNDRSVYLARLARAHVTAGDLEQGAEAATKSLGIVTHTGSARTFAELSSVARAVDTKRTVPAVATFFERFEIVRDRFVA